MRGDAPRTAPSDRSAALGANGIALHLVCAARDHVGDLVTDALPLLFELIDRLGDAAAGLPILLAVRLPNAFAESVTRSRSSAAAFGASHIASPAPTNVPAINPTAKP